MLKLDSKIRVAELSDICYSLLRCWEVAQDVKEDTYLASLFERLQTNYDELNTAIKQTKTKSNLAEKDAIRDEKLSVIHQILKAFQVVPNQEMKDAALRLLEIFNKYGIEIISKNYNEQSGFINSLLADFSRKKAATDINKIPTLSDAVEELKAAQEDFHNNYLMYNNEVKTKDKNQKTATSLKPPIVQLINSQLITYLNGVVLSQSEKYQNFYDIIDQLITDINLTMSRRGGKPESDDEEITDSDQNPSVETTA